MGLSERDHFAAHPRCERMNANTSPARTASTGLATTEKKICRSNAVVRTVFGLHRAATARWTDVRRVGHYALMACWFGRSVTCCLLAALTAACANDPNDLATPSTATTGAPFPTNAEAPTTVATELDHSSSGVPTAQSIEMESGSLHYVLPSDAAADPLPMPSLPAFVIGYAKWFTDCCFVKITVQNFGPPMPPEEAVGMFWSEGMEWRVYDSGPRDGTQMQAAATGELGTVLIGAQVRFPQQNQDPAVARILVEALARTVSTSTST